LIPELPAIELDLLEDLSPPEASGFLTLLRQRYRARYRDGSVSQPFIYDQVRRAALDAVVIVPHFLAAPGQRCVYLRSALRPPLLSRHTLKLAEPERHPRGELWELPAGLVEANECTPLGLRQCAQRELHEEVGFRVAVERFSALGHSTLPCPGVIAERQYYFDIEVDPNERHEPVLDGSALEHDGVIAVVSLEAALGMCRSGQLDDAKTELALRRLAEKFQ